MSDAIQLICTKTFLYCDKAELHYNKNNNNNLSKHGQQLGLGGTLEF